MLSKIRDFFDGFPNKDFVKNAAPPVNTPDLCLLEQQEFHWIFDYRNMVHSACAFKEVYTDQRFYMWLRNHEERTPPLVFNESIHPERMSERARLKGKLHLVTPKALAELDKTLENRVNSDRRRIRIVFPFFKEGQKRKWEVATPVRISAWVYFDQVKVWKPRFEYDYDFWHGRKDTAYTPARTFRDERPFISRYFTPTEGKAYKPRCTFAVFNINRLRQDLQLEEKEYSEQKKWDEQQHQTNGKPAPVPQVS